MKEKLPSQKITFYSRKEILFPLRIMAIVMTMVIMQLNAIGAPLQQQIRITGTVTDVTGQTLPGVNIVVKGTTIGATSDLDGKYSISTTEQNAILVFSFIGYVTQEVPVDGKNVIDVVLLTGVTGLDEVVVVGYGIQDRATVTGAVSSVQSDIITRTPTVTTSGALVGKVPGINTRQTDGRPGGITQIQIRNMGNPLFVIDGVPSNEADFNNLSADDIESISILKDASAAIYGFRASNGVILITTKKGKIGDKVSVNVKSHYALQNYTQQPRPPDAYTYMRGLATSNQNLGITNPSWLSAEELAKWEQGTEKGYISTDYYDFMIRPNAPMTSATASVSGGGTSSRYYFSFADLSQKSQFNMDDESGYRRNTFMANIESSLMGGLKFITQINGRLETRQQTGTPSGNDYFNHFFTIYQMWPTERPYANDNPLYPNADVHSINVLPSTYTRDIAGYKTDNIKAISPLFALQYNFDFGLTAKATYSYSYRTQSWETFQYSFNTYRYGASTDTYEPRPGRSSGSRFSRNQGTVGRFGQFQLNYNKAFGDHTISAVAAYERSDEEITNLQVNSLPPNNTVDIIYFTDQTNLSNSWNVSARAGYVGRLNYGYKNKYLIEALARYDGSYLYDEDNRWGFFPAISMGWRPLEENFMSGVKNVLSDLKLRASYGQTGSELGVSAFGYMQGFDYGQGNNAFNNVLYTGVRPRGLPVTDLSWVTNISSNIGVDFGFLENRFTGAFDVFQRRREGLPAAKYDVLLPLEVGYSLPNQNLNSDAHMGIEGMLTYTSKRNESGFNYSISGNATLARRKTLESYKPRFGNSWDEYRNSAENRLSDINWGYQVIGIFKSQDEINNYPIIIDGQGNRTLLPGDFIFKDVNGDGIIDALDMRPLGYARGATPYLNFGLYSTFNYKRVTLSLDFAGATLQTYERRFENQIPMQFNGAGVGLLITDAWQRADPYDPNSEWIPGSHPAVRVNQTNHPNFLNRNDFWFVNVLYCRLRNLMLNYEVPKTITSKVGIGQLNVYVQGTNLFSLDNMKQYQLDPEIAAVNAFVNPPQRLYLFGLNVTF